MRTDKSFFAVKSEIRACREKIEAFENEIDDLKGGMQGSLTAGIILIFLAFFLQGITFLLGLIALIHSGGNQIQIVLSRKDIDKEKDIIKSLNSEVNL